LKTPPDCKQIIESQKELFSEEPNFNEDRENEAPRGSFVGTEDYIAPEVVNSEPSTFASDLWSLGVVIFQLFTGKTPFKADGDQSTLDKILACDYQMPSEEKIPLDA
jgi:serine/threonine protein kinase